MINRTISIKLDLGGASGPAGANTVVNDVEGWGVPGTIEGIVPNSFHDTDKEAMSNGWVMSAVAKTLPTPSASIPPPPSTAGGHKILDEALYHNRSIDGNGIIVPEEQYQGMLDRELIPNNPYSNSPTFSIKEIVDIIDSSDIPGASPFAQFSKEVFIWNELIIADPHPRIASVPGPNEFAYWQMVFFNEGGDHLMTQVMRFTNPYSQSLAPLTDQGLNGRLNKFLYVYQHQAFIKLQFPVNIIRPNSFVLPPMYPTPAQPNYLSLVFSDMLSSMILGVIHTLIIDTDYIFNKWSELELGGAQPSGNFKVSNSLISVPYRYSRDAPPQATRDC